MEEYSILDRVISSRQDQDIRNFNPADIISSLFKYLSGKEEDVLRRRFGLGGKERETLENIGKVYNVTRERIRQIERTAIRKLKGLDGFHDIVRPLENMIHATLRKSGGAIAEETLLQELLSFSSDTPANRRSVLFLLHQLLNEKFAIIEENDSLRPGWRLHVTSVEFIEGIIVEAVEFIKNHGQPLTKETLLNTLRNQEFYQKYQDKLDEHGLLSYLDLSQKVDRNPFGEYGLVDWGSIKPRRMNDKIYLVLKKEGKPLHFNKITERINEIGFDKRKAYPPTVHNELILNTEYVLVGRGIYALQEWGYQPGVVAEVLVNILREHGEPMHRDELVQKVLEKRMVKKNTIHLALNDRARFRKMPDGKYHLIEGDVVLEEGSEEEPDQKTDQPAS